MDNQITVETPAPVSTVGILDEFQTDFIAAWRQLPNKGFFFALLIAWIVLFQFMGNPIRGYTHSSSLFALMYEAYNSPNPAAENDRHGNLIPFLVLGLFWWKRKTLLSLSHRIWMPALGVLMLGMLLHIVGYRVQQPRLCMIGFFTGIYGLMGLSWGFDWLKNSFFPFFLFVFCIPLGDNAQFLTFRLQLLVCWLVEHISHVITINVNRVGTRLFDPAGTYQYEVVAACSGIRSFFAILMLTTAYGFLSFHSWWKRIVMMAMSLPLAVL